MTDAPVPRRIAQLREKLTVFETAPSFHEWNLLEIAYNAYLVNADALADHVGIPQNDPRVAIALLDADPTAEVPNWFQQELLRMLINYSATASTLVDHSRHFMQRYEQVNPELLGSYEDRRAEVVALDAVHFIKNLRNYLLHYRFPSVTRTLSFTMRPSTSSFEIRLDTRKLLEWGGWNRQAKAYMRGKDAIVLIDTVEAYTSAIRGLYEWLFSQIEGVVRKAAVQKGDIETELVDLEYPSPSE